MSYGLTVISNTGHEVIDSTYRNYGLIQSGTGTMRSWDNLNQTPRITKVFPERISFPTQTSVPLVYIRPPYGVTITTGHDVYEPTYDPESPSFLSGIEKSEFHVFCQKNTDDGKLYSYAVFAPVSGNSADSHGIRVWNGSSQVVFDSGYKYSTIDDITAKTFPNPTSISDYNTWSINRTISAPTYGSRYLLLNSLQSVGAIGVDDGVDGTNFDVWRIGGRINSETSVTYEGATYTYYEAGTPPGTTPIYLSPGQTYTLISGFLNV